MPEAVQSRAAGAPRPVSNPRVSMRHRGSGAQGGFWAGFRAETPGATSEHAAPTTTTAETSPSPSQVRGGKEKHQTISFFYLFPDLLWLTSATLVRQKQLANSDAVWTPRSQLPPSKPGHPPRSPDLQAEFSTRSFGIVLLLLSEESRQKSARLQGETESHVNFCSPGSGILLRVRSLVENYQLSS